MADSGVPLEDPNPQQPVDLDGLLALARAATPGPWRLYARYLVRNGCVIGKALDREDAEFISAADPSVVAALVERVRQLTTDNENLTAEVEWYEDWSNTLAEQMPENYDGDEAQEAIIERFVADGASALAQLEALGDPQVEYGMNFLEVNGQARCDIALWPRHATHRRGSGVGGRLPALAAGVGGVGEYTMTAPREKCSASIEGIGAPLACNRAWAHRGWHMTADGEAWKPTLVDASRQANEGVADIWAALRHRLVRVNRWLFEDRPRHKNWGSR